MEFNEIDKELIEKNMLEPARKDLKRYKKILLVDATFLLLAILFSFLKSDVFITPEGSEVVTYLLLLLSMSGFLILVCRISALIYKKSKEKNKYYGWVNSKTNIVFNTNFTVDIFIDSSQIVKNANITRYIPANKNETFFIVVQASVNHSIITKMLEFPHYFIAQDELMNYIRQHILVNEMMNFKNESLKKIFGMNKEERNKLFVKELQDTTVLVPIKLVNPDAMPTYFVEIGGIKFELLNDNKKIKVYTSLEEYQTKHDDYEKLWQMSIKDIAAPLLESINTIVKSDEFSITINPDSDKVVLSSKLLRNVFRI